MYLFIYFLFFFRKKLFQHILEFNRNLFIKSIMITGIFEKYSNKNKIDFNRKNLRLQNNFRLKKFQSNKSNHDSRLRLTQVWNDLIFNFMNVNKNFIKMEKLNG